MKKLLSVLLLAVLVLAGCGSKPADASDKTFTVLNGAPLTGFFIPDYDNSSYDADVLNLLNKASTVYIDTVTGEFKFNPTVLDGEPEIEVIEGLGKTYTYKIKEGLKYSDGTDITARDYVFSVLFRANVAHVEQAVFASLGQGLVGYNEYSAGETDVFEGVKLIDDYTFSVTIDENELPYFFERLYVTIDPQPIHIWMPEAEFNADGNGFTNSAEELAAAETRVQGMQSNPSYSTGPYVLQSYENKIATFTINEHYAGDEKGNKPTIGTLVIRDVEDAVLLDSLRNNEGDYAEGFIDGDQIREGLDYGLKDVNFPRSAYGKILFKADTFPTNIKEVRQALGYVVSRNTFVEAITGGFGAIVDGPYGLSTPYYIANRDEILSQITQYTLNFEEANRILDTTEFKFEADGTTPWDPEKAVANYENGYFRHNAEGTVLEVKHYSTVEAATVSDLVATTFPTGAAQAGIKYTMVSGDWATMLTLIRGQEYNAYNFATSFPSVIYDPLTSFHSDFVGRTNNAAIADENLDRLIEELRANDPADTEGFYEDFVNYVVAWNDLLPELPLYSNQIYNFATDRVEGLDVLTPFYNWAQAIEYITVTK